MTLSTILFDLDGTLVDTAPDLAYALNALLLENGVEEKPYEVIKPLVAHGGKALITMGFECNESHPEFTQRHQRLLQIYTDNCQQSYRFCHPQQTSMSLDPLPIVHKHTARVQDAVCCILACCHTPLHRA
jgi:phosphoglycolate phosphatase-like HAD superfamily hydrolase